MRIPISCYLIKCDECDTKLDGGDFEPHFPAGDSSGDNALDNLEAADWWTDGERHLCEEHKPPMEEREAMEETTADRLRRYAELTTGVDANRRRRRVS